MARDAECRVEIWPGGQQALAGVIVARRFTTRLFGMTRKTGAVLFERCTSVHMMGMDRPIDVAALSAPIEGGGRLVIAVDRARPWKGVPRHTGCDAVLEAEAGMLEAAGIAAGKAVRIEYARGKAGPSRDVRIGE